MKLHISVINVCELTPQWATFILPINGFDKEYIQKLVVQKNTAHSDHDVNKFAKK